MRDKLEKLLCQVHQKSYSTLVGNATTGLYLALISLGLQGKRVAIPNSVCTNVPLAILLSGNTPVYLDVTLHDLGIDVAELIRQREKYDAVIAVHAYGSVCNILDIGVFCKSQGIPLIEDLAVAQGASIDGLPLGTFSDVAVVSFGVGKIIDVGHGGAVVTNDRFIFEEILKRSAMMSPQSELSKEAVNEFAKYHTNLYNMYYESNINSFSTEFKARGYTLKPHILCGFDRSYESQIFEKLINLNSLVRSRRNKVELFQEHLAHFESSGSIEILRSPDGSVPWRFNVLIDCRDKLLKSLLSRRIKVSSWHPSVDLFFENRCISAVNTPVSDHIGDKILNFWINEDADFEYIKFVANILINHISANQD